MMRIHLFAALCCLGLGAQAQNWCPPGATWTYSSVISQYATNRIIRYTGDTIIGGESAQTLFTVDQFVNPTTLEIDTFGTGGNSWTRFSDSVVWAWSPTENAWDTLYYFGAVPGSQWEPPFAEPGFCGSAELGDMVQVLDTGTTVVQGVPLQYWDIHLGAYWGRVTERMGWSVGMIPFSGCWQDYTSALTCYADDEISYVATGATGCDLITRISTATLPEAMLHPNPGMDRLILTLPPGQHTITLFDATGRMVHQQHTQDTPATIDTAHLPSGIYMVKVDEGVQPLRWVKE